MSQKDFLDEELICSSYDAKKALLDILLSIDKKKDINDFVDNSVDLADEV